MPGLARTPPRQVLRTLRQEVGFCCPVGDCGNPYLTWHHFDPPWRVEEHHRPEGMIALCREHADKADNGSFTDDQLRMLKREGRSRALAIQGRFDWMRQDLLAVVAGNFYYKPGVIFSINDRPCIWFDRDENNCLLLNFSMPTLGNCPRAKITQNMWTVPPAVDELICPPNGRLIDVSYSNGDRFRTEFYNIQSEDWFLRRYPTAERLGIQTVVNFPITVVELWETAAGTEIEFGPKNSRVLGGVITNNFFESAAKIIHLEIPQDAFHKLFPDDTAR